MRKKTPYIFVELLEMDQEVQSSQDHKGVVVKIFYKEKKFPLDRATKVAPRPLKDIDKTSHFEDIYKEIISNKELSKEW